MVTINGTAGADILDGTSGNDIINGLEGNDTLSGFAGDDTLRGDAGDDLLYGGNGNDRLYGGDGNDFLDPGGNVFSGSGFADYINAGTGNDTIDFSGAGAAGTLYDISHWGLDAGISVAIDRAANTGTIDKGANGTTVLTDVAAALSADSYGIRIYGTGFDDTFDITLGGGGTVAIREDGGNDTISIGAGSGAVILEFTEAAGGILADLATGTIANDGFGGTDTITGAGHVGGIRATFYDDAITGGAADEWFELYTGNDTLDGGGGFDTLSYAVSWTITGLQVDLDAGSATGSLAGTAFSHAISGIEHVRGSAGDDILLGVTGRADLLEGGDGNDLLEGRGGRDRLFGDAGNDEIRGARGNDILQGGTGRDKLLGAGGRDVLRGGEHRDRLLGGNGDDRLFGGRGNDVLSGGNGDDWLVGGGGGDRFVFSAGQDVIGDFNTASLREKIDLSGVAALTDFAVLQSSYLNEVAGNAVIDDGAGNTLTLEGVAMADLGAGDFIF